MAKKPPTFEEAVKQLETIADQIERGEIGLEESIVKYEDGMKLVNQCRQILTQAEQRILKLQPGTDTPVESKGDGAQAASASDSDSNE